MNKQGHVFRESRMLGRRLGMKPLPAGTFLYMDDEKLVMSLRREINTVRVYLHSTITDEEVSSGVVIPPEGRFDANLIIETFEEETVDFVCDYFDDLEDADERILDFDESIDDMKRILKGISKSK